MDTWFPPKGSHTHTQGPTRLSFWGNKFRAYVMFDQNVQMFMAKLGSTWDSLSKFLQIKGLIDSCPYKIWHSLTVAHGMMFYSWVKVNVTIPLPLWFHRSCRGTVPSIFTLVFVDMETLVNIIYIRGFGCGSETCTKMAPWQMESLISSHTHLCPATTFQCVPTIGVHGIPCVFA